MTNEQKLLANQNRLNTILGRGDKAFKCPGVARKIRRNIRNLEAKVNAK